MITKLKRTSFKAKQEISDLFLKQLLALTTPKAKRDLIKKHNPFFYTLF